MYQLFSLQDHYTLTLRKVKKFFLGVSLHGMVSHHPWSLALDREKSPFWALSVVLLRHSWLEIRPDLARILQGFPNNKSPSSTPVLCFILSFSSDISFGSRCQEKPPHGTDLPWGFLISTSSTLNDAIVSLFHLK
jgi:hypothetical protein